MIPEKKLREMLDATIYSGQEFDQSYIQTLHDAIGRPYTSGPVTTENAKSVIIKYFQMNGWATKE